MEKPLLLIAVIISWSFFFLLRRDPKHYWSTPWDKHVPVIPIFVVPYLALFPFVIIASLLLLRTSFSTEFFVSVFAANVMAALFWYFIPTGIHHPLHLKDAGFSKWIAWVYRHDGPANVFPSSHVFSSVICGYYLALAYPAEALWIWILTGLIAVSTVFVKQHYLLDIAGGLLCATGAIGIAYLVL
jgi:membrane-associated phospholipid phosphatase